MEEYTLVNLETSQVPISIKQGKFYQKVHGKHVGAYGEFGAANIRDNIMSTYNEAMAQIENQGMNNNMLLVGKVQSGKTSNLELFTALAFDNGFNLVVIYGGYDNTLLSQTTTRFKKTFDIPNETDYSTDTPVVFSSDDSAQLLTVDNRYTFSTQTGKAYYCNSIPGFIADQSTDIVGRLVRHAFDIN